MTMDMDNEYGIWKRLGLRSNSKLTMGFPKTQLVIYLLSVTSKLCLLWGSITVKINTYYYIKYGYTLKNGQTSASWLIRHGIPLY